MLELKKGGWSVCGGHARLYASIAQCIDGGSAYTHSLIRPTYAINHTSYSLFTQILSNVPQGK